MGQVKLFGKSFPNYSIFFLLITGCTHLPSTQERLENATKLAEDAGWTSETISTSYFDLQAFLPAQRLKHKRLTILIEGDGLAWISPSKSSSDPTPLNPVSLKLALAYKPDHAVAYLGRPCQFTSQNEAQCTQKYWTSHRFSEEVIIATDEAITALKTMTGASEVQLMGYSGGGAVAALVASRRVDVARLVTFAGNLDTTAWTELHQISPLSGSLNPADAVTELQAIPQVHYVGGHDRVIPAEIVESFHRLLHPKTNSQIIIIPEADHRCCWQQVIREMK